MASVVTSRAAAVVLCGGESRRMGTPKAWLDWDGEPLLSRVVRVVAEVAEPIVVVAAVDQVLPPLPAPVVAVRDRVGRRGPLEGLGTGLAALDARATDAPWVLVVSTDAPWLAPEFLARLVALAAADPSCDAVVPSVGGRRHPLCAVYGRRVATAVDELLARGERRAMALLDVIATRLADEATLLADPALAAADPQLRSLGNVNTRDDYEAARRRL